MKIRFIGALGSVTGSCTLFAHRGRYYLVDCGAQQGTDAVDGEATVLPFKPRGIQALFLTHAHLDHCGMLPELIHQGFTGDIYCTRATADLTRLALADAAALPAACFTTTDVGQLRFVCLDDLPEHQFGKFRGIAPNLSVSLIRTSHVLGSVGFEFQFSGGPAKNPASHRTIVFSGDLGCNTEENCYQSLLNARQYPSTHAEFLVCESTYGGRVRNPSFASFEERIRSLRKLLQEAAAHGSGANIIFPCFTLQRLQDLLVDLHCLLEQTAVDAIAPPCKSVMNLPVEVVVDSPLAVKYGEVFIRELQRVRANGKPSYLNPELAGRLNLDHEKLATFLKLLFDGSKRRTVFQNYVLSYGNTAKNEQVGVRIIIAGSGMCIGGRVMEHLKRCLPLPNTTVAITGYQGFGTPGSELMKRAANPRAAIDGKAWGLDSAEIKARVVDLSGFFSGHADHAGLLDYIFYKQGTQPYRPLKWVFLVHGDDNARTELCRAIEKLKRQNSSARRIIERVELPNPAGPWFDLVREKWVWEFHPKVENADQAVNSGFGRLEKLEKMVQSFCEKGPNAISLDEIIDQVNLAKFHLASARGAESGGT
jgi:metallo-beta-lactamase family protein